MSTRCDYLQQPRQLTAAELLIVLKRENRKERVERDTNFVRVSDDGQKFRCTWGWFWGALSRLAYEDANRLRFYTDDELVHQFSELPGFVLAAHIGETPAAIYLCHVFEALGIERAHCEKYVWQLMEMFKRRCPTPMPWCKQELIEDYNEWEGLRRPRYPRSPHT